MRLQKIVIPKSVVFIGAEAFSDCPNLENIQVDPENPTYSSFDGVLMPAERTNIICCPPGRKGALEIFESVQKINQRDFSGCFRLEKIYLPASIEYIDSGAFSDCRNLVLITVDSTNKYFNCLDGVLFDKKFVRLIFCSKTISGDYPIPASVTHIEAYAFAFCRELTGISISEPLHEIGSCAFWACEKLENFPDLNSSTAIGKSIFSGCPKIPDSDLEEDAPIGLAEFIRQHLEEESANSNE